ncbi:MAG: long-chain fatty acid--CoA ligase [Chloroflexi bacterium]|nr:long-chain fatty acid--CoA ligase [Chloroflexota bacterium]
MERPWLRHYPTRIGLPIKYPAAPLYQLLADTANTHPDRVALVFFGRKTTYSALLDEVKRVAAGLVRLGLKKGDRVGIMLPNCPQLVASYFGALWAGGVVVMVNPLYTPRELQLQLSDSGARFLIALDLTYPRVVQALDGTPLEKVIVTGLQERLPFPLNLLYPLKLRREGHAVRVPEGPKTMRYSHLVAESGLEEAVHVDPKETPALLQYTGGTTGVPKGVVLTHSNLIANCVQLQHWLPPFSRGQVTVLGALPFFHAYGMTTVMNFGILIGARIILLPRFRVADLLKAIQKYRPQLFPGVPTMYVAINNYPGVERFDLKSIEWCISGAASLPLEVKETFERLTGGRLVEGFGLTEAAPVTHANPLDGLQKQGSIGVPMPDTEACVVDLTTGERVPPGAEGEMLVRGPQVMQGYWGRPDETADVLKDGWLHTGDVARMDKDGYFYIVGRKKEMVLVSGFNVYPREVEEVLHAHPAVMEAAVIGVPDRYQGEAVKAFVVLKPGAQCSPEELLVWARERLAPYKVPKQVEFASELPKTLIGKVLHRALKEQEAAKVSSAASTAPQGAQADNKTGA